MKVDVDESVSNSKQIAFYPNEKGHLEPEIEPRKNANFPASKNRRDRRLKGQLNSDDQ